jgi:hypothetical protein
LPSLSFEQKYTTFSSNSSLDNLPDNIIQPLIHFNNLNQVSRNIYYGSVIGTLSTIFDASYLPNFRNVDHLTTPLKRKVEYFFNKRNLSMHFSGNYGYYKVSPSGSLQYNIVNPLTGTSVDVTATYIIDNLKFYETDMIPFFKYFENVNIGLDSFLVDNSNTPFGGIATGIGQYISLGTIYRDPPPSTFLTTLSGTNASET